MDKQEPYAWIVMAPQGDYFERSSEVIAHLEATGLTKCKPLFLQPAPSISVRVPDEIDRKQAVFKLKNHDYTNMPGAGYEYGWKDCRAEMLSLNNKAASPGVD